MRCIAELCGIPPFDASVDAGSFLPPRRWGRLRPARRHRHGVLWRRRRQQVDSLLVEPALTPHNYRARLRVPLAPRSRPARARLQRGYARSRRAHCARRRARFHEHHAVSNRLRYARCVPAASDRGALWLVKPFPGDEAEESHDTAYQARLVGGVMASRLNIRGGGHGTCRRTWRRTRAGGEAGRDALGAHSRDVCFETPIAASRVCVVYGCLCSKGSRAGVSGPGRRP